MSGRCSRMLLTALAMLLATSGCARLESMRQYLTSNDYVDGTEQIDERWVTKAGNEARGDRPRETDPDSWWTWISSAKARGIEKNFNVDY